MKFFKKTAVLAITISMLFSTIAFADGEKPQDSSVGSKTESVDKAKDSDVIDFVNVIKNVFASEKNNINKNDEKLSQTNLNPDDLKIEKIDGALYVVDEKSDTIVKYRDLKNGIVKVKDKKFILDPNDNSVKLNLFDSNGKTYYATLDEGLHRGWQYIGKDLYYFDPADYYAYKGGIWSTITGVFWFGDDGKIKTGSRPSGINKKVTYANTDSAYHTIIYTQWYYPTEKERSNDFLKDKNLPRLMKGQKVANIAARYDHLPFQWFGVDLDDPNGVYCCGLSYSAYKKAGITIPGKTECDIYADSGHEMVKAQYLQAEKFGGEHVEPNINALQPGDIMIMPTKGVRKYSHVMLYLGKNHGRPIVMHASHRHGVNISVNPYSSNASFVAVRYY